MLNNLIIKRVLITFSILLVSFNCFGQLRPKKITIHTTSGDVITCKAWNFSLRNKASNIKYVEKKGEDFKIMPLDSIKYIQYKKKKIVVAKDIIFDNTTNDVNKLSRLGEKSYTKMFFLSKKQLFIEVLLEGEINLYGSFLDGIRKYLFNPEGIITPLLYKVYFIPRPNGYIGSDKSKKNNFYLQQLRNYIPLYDSKGGLISPEYQVFHLISYFEKYNSDKK
jgi:hypothetical protein